MDREQRLAIENEVEASGGAVGVNLEQTFADLRSNSKVTKTFDYTTFGNVPTPPSSFSNGITGTEWDDYTDRLETFTGGALLSYSVNVYSKTDYKQCGVYFDEEDVEDPIDCYQDFAGTVESYDRTTNAVDRQAERVEYMINNPNKVDWGGKRSVTKPNYEDWLGTYNNCKDKDGPVNTAFSECESDFKTGQYTKVCRTCSMPDGCSQSELKNELGQYATAVIRVPGQLETPPASELENYDEPERISEGNGYSKADIKTAEDKYLCLLTRVSGGFRGTGEKIKLTAEKNSNDVQKWYLDIDSQRTDSEHKLRGGVTCVRKDNFFGTNGSPDWYSDKSFSVTYPGSGSEETTPISSRPRINAVTGLSGKMAGGAEQVQIQQPASTIQTGGQKQSGYDARMEFQFWAKEPQESGRW
jgi:hypothetical protein